MKRYRVMNSFNPTMVRLLLLVVALHCIALPWFQSHNGAIAAAEVDF